MSTRSLDSTAGVSPLDALFAPAPRDNPADGTFAQHFTAPAKTPAPPPVVTPRAKDVPPKSESRDEPQDERLAVPSAVTSPERSSPESEEPAATANSDTSDQPPKAPTAEASDDVPVAEVKDEEEAVVQDDSATDELLLTCVAPITQPAAAEEIVAEPSADTADETKVAAIADEVTGQSKSKGAAFPKATKTAASQPPAVLNAAAPAEDVSPAGETVEPPATSALAADAIETSTTDVTASAAEVSGVVTAESLVNASEDPKPQAPVKGTTKSRASKDLPAEADAEEPTAEVATESVRGVDVEPEQAVDKPRPSKRDRLRADSRNLAADSAAPTKEPAAQATSATTTNAEATALTSTSTAAPPEARSPGDLSIPTPVAAAATTSTSTTHAAPQSLQRLPQQLLARSTSQGSRGAPPNPAEQARFVTRVAKAFQTAQARGGELQLRLSPAELGSLKIEIKLKEGVMSARVEAESTNAKNLLVDNLPVLKERLAEQGIVVEKFDVELMDRQPQGQPDTTQERERRHAPRGTIKTGSEEMTTAPAAASEARALRSDGRLNVTV